MLDDEGHPQAERLEQMKSEFLVAQRRRRARAPETAAPPDATDERPLEVGLADGRLASVVAVRPWPLA